MFDKIKKAMEKQPKKSKEQKDYEENQHNQKSEMQATFRECVNRMRDMGWQMQPVWRHINDTIPNIAAAEIMLMPISFDQHQQIEEVLEKQKAVQEGTTSTTPDEQNQGTVVSEEATVENIPSED